MAYVKLDCGMLHSTLWVDRDARELFITALLLAVPREFTEPIPQLRVDSMEPTGWVVPPGWYGFAPAAGVGLIRHSGMENVDAGMKALARMGEPEPDSRSQAHEGRRLVRVDGGYIVLNYMDYRDKDHTAAERQRRYRERKRLRRDETLQPCNITHSIEHRADTEAEQSQNPVSEPKGSSTPESNSFPDKPSITPVDKSSSAAAPAKRQRKPPAEPKTASVWTYYLGAYLERYGTEPVRNAKVNSQLAQFVDRVGVDDAGPIAAFFVRSNSPWYVRKGHTVGVMLEDAEKLATEWRTGREIAVQHQEPKGKIARAIEAYEREYGPTGTGNLQGAAGHAGAQHGKRPVLDGTDAGGESPGG